MTLRANPGGRIPPDQVIGRDHLIARIWHILERQSVLLTAERRMGKTSIIQKMVNQPPRAGLHFYQDLEGVRSELEFVEKVLERVEHELSKRQRFATRARQFLKEVGGLEVGGVLRLPEGKAPEWKNLLTRVMEDLVETHSGPVVFFWDEMPLMLHNIAKRSGEAAAMEVLDYLRSMRQMHPTVRMVYTGSIGLHNVVTTLRRAGHANDATNDMQIQDVPPLDPSDARELVLRLLEGEGLETLEPLMTAHALAEAVDHMPYYIHHVVDGLAQSGATVTQTMVRDEVAQRLTDPQDPWHLRYYVDRISTYYESSEKTIALALLDTLAGADRSLPLTRIVEFVASRVPVDDNEKVRTILVLLQQDHYVFQNVDGTFRFRSALIQRFWRLHRGLEA